MKINLDRLNDITGGDETMNQTLLALFNKTFNRCLSAIEGLDVTNPEAAQKPWHDAIHELKGAAGNLGFDELFEVCKNYDMQPVNEQLKSELISIIKSMEI